MLSGTRAIVDGAVIVLSSRRELGNEAERIFHNTQVSAVQRDVHKSIHY